MDKEQLLVALKAALAEKNQSKLEDLGKQAVENFPDDTFGYVYLAEAMMLLEEPKYAHAEMLLAKAIQLDSNNLEYKLRFGAIKEEQGLLSDAAILYRQVLNSDANNFAALKGLGVTELYDSQDYESAIDFLTKALSIKSSDSDVYAMLAESYNNLGRYQDALTATNKGLAGGFHEGCATAKLITLEFLHSTEGADDLFRKLVEIRPEEFTYRFNFGKLLLEEGKAAEAEAQFVKALSIIDDGNPLLRNLLADALLKQGKFAEALKRYEECIKILDSDPYLYASRAEAKLGLKDDKGAMADLDIAIAKAGDDPVATAPFIVQKALAYQVLGDVKKAKELLKPLCENNVTRAEGCYGIGIVLHRSGNDEMAYTMLKVSKQMKHIEAIKYIELYLSDYLHQKRQAILQNNAAEISKNAQSAFLNKISGKLWRFKDLKSKKMDAFDEKLQAKIKESLGVLSVVFTEKGVVFMNDGEGDALTYKINNESADNAKMEFRVLDGDRTFGVEIKFDNKNILFSKEENEWITLEEQDLKTIPTALKDNFKGAMKKEQVDYLGDKAKAVLQAIY